MDVARRRIAPVVIDAAVAVAVAAVMCLTIHGAWDPQIRRPVDGWAYLIGMAIGGVLLLRRRRPVVVLGATAVLLFVYYALGYPGFEPALPLAVALYTAAVAGHPHWAAGVAAFYAAAEMFVRGFNQGEPPYLLVVALAQQLALLAVLILLGVTVRNRADRLARAAAERQRESARLVAEERLRIAREVHDILGHAMAAITVQAGFAADVLDRDPARARSAVHTVLVTARSAMTELKATVGLLRQPDHGLAPTPGLADLEGLVAHARTAGLRVCVRVAGARRDLPAVVELCAARIVQESLTNVARHSRATTATVSLDYRPTELLVEVTNDGHSSPDPPRPGHGLTGMAERAAALGGLLQAGPGTGGGFHVLARLPIGVER